MNYLLKLGPVQLGVGETSVYLRVADTGEVSAPVFAPDDHQGVAAARGDLDGSALRCEPALAEAARAAELLTASPPLSAREARAAIALFMAWSQKGIAAIGSDLALLFLKAMGPFLGAQPWSYWPDHQPIPVRSSGAVERAYEASVFGADDGGYGLALYERAGSVQRVLELQAQGEAAQAAQLPGIAVLLDDKPVYALEAMREAGLPGRVPVPVKSSPLGPGIPSPEECVVLLAALRCFSELTPDELRAQAQLEVRGAQVTVKVEAPTPLPRA